MNDAINTNIFNMRRYQRQGQGLFNQGLASFQPGAVAQTIGQGQQQQFTNAGQQAVATGLGGQQTLGGPAQADVAARAQLGNQAMGNFAGYSALPHGWNVQNAQLWPQLGVVNSEASNMNSLLPALLNIASRSQQKRASAGQLVQGLGSLVGGLGGLGGSTAAPAVSSMGTMDEQI